MLRALKKTMDIVYVSYSVGNLTTKIKITLRIFHRDSLTFERN